MIILGIFLLMYIVFYLVGGIDYITDTYNDDKINEMLEENPVKVIIFNLVVGLTSIAFVIGLFVFILISMTVIGYWWIGLILLTLAFYDFVLVGWLQMEPIKNIGYVTNIGYVAYLVYVLSFYISF